MAGCDGNNCSIGWFHLACLPPEVARVCSAAVISGDMWLCPLCAEAAAIATAAAAEPNTAAPVPAAPAALPTYAAPAAEVAAPPAPPAPVQPMFFSSRARVRELRRGALLAQVVAHKLMGETEAKNLKAGALCDVLIERLHVPARAPLAAKSVSESTVVNLTRGLHTCTLLHLSWNDVRGSVLDYARAQLPSWCPEEDADLIAKICDTSSYFYGLWLFFDMQLLLATEPFLAWTDGNFEPFMRLFPSMCAFIATVNKPKVQRAMILKQYCLVHYAEEHPDVLQTLMVNSPVLVETTCEYHNARMKRWIGNNVANPTHNDYVTASTICMQADAMRAEMKGMASKAKAGETDRVKALHKAEKPGFADTKAQACKFILAPFTAMIDQIAADGKCSGEYSDSEWPRGEVASLADGQAKLETVGLLSLQKHLESFANGGAATAMPTDLRAFLKSPFAKVADLKAECRRRGLRASANKPDLADAIAKHAEKNPGGFKNEDAQDKEESSEFGFGKKLPALPRFFSEAQSNAGQMAAAAAADDDDDADDPTDDPKMGDL